MIPLQNKMLVDGRAFFARSASLPSAREPIRRTNCRRSSCAKFRTTHGASTTRRTKTATTKGLMPLQKTVFSSPKTYRDGDQGTQRLKQTRGLGAATISRFI